MRVSTGLRQSPFVHVKISSVTHYNAALDEQLQAQLINEGYTTATKPANVAWQILQTLAEMLETPKGQT